MEIGFASQRLVHEMFGVFVTTKKSSVCFWHTIMSTSPGFDGSTYKQLKSKYILENIERQVKCVDSRIPFEPEHAFPTRLRIRQRRLRIHCAST